MATAVDLFRAALMSGDLATAQSLVESERVHAEVALNTHSWTALHCA
jgi:hypothetical protein